MTASNDGSRLRSAQWYAGDDRNACIHRAWMRRGVPGGAYVYQGDELGQMINVSVSDIDTLVAFSMSVTVK